LVLAGRVHTGTGQPRSGAAITVIDPDGEEVVRGSTDKSGRFEVGGLPGGTYTVLAISLPYNPAAALVAGSAGETAIELIMHGQGSITGRLLAGAARSPLAGSQVSLVDQQGTSSVPDVTTDDRGRYRFDEVPEGSWSLYAQCPGHRSATVNVDVTAGDEIEREVILVPLGRIQGRVVLDGGAPVADVHLSLVRGDGHIVAATATDAYGWYHFPDLEPAPYVVVCLTMAPEPDLLTVEPGQTLDYSVRVGTLPTP
jgi:hypothetical protein